MVVVTALNLEIPEDILNSLNLPPGQAERELRKELALALYARGVLSIGKAADYAEMNRGEFEEVLGQRRVHRHYGSEELEEDLDFANGGTPQ